MKKNKSFLILSIDGGGIRGIYPAYILKRIQDEYKISFNSHFDLIIGTSTGSIIAALLAVGISAVEITKFYENEGYKIFKKAKRSFMGFYKSKYDNLFFKSLLSEKLGNLTLGDITKTKLLIPSTDISNGTIHVLKSSYSKDFVRDNKVLLSEAILASCSAPLYFNPSFIDVYLLADGGLWANNPSLVGYTEAITRLNINPVNVKVFSIGTGIGKKYYDPAKINMKWGFLNGWHGSKLIDMILNLQSINVDNTLELILKNKYYRINFEENSELTLDDISIIPTLKSKADIDFTHNSKSVRSFLEI
ncbi:MAG TPA: CBASS cGAMP-activated phospholipase [Spirochaetota bacterium]|nr:CBASS cGAMP-activated phospholipase [Spirochaetota bacterium]